MNIQGPLLDVAPSSQRPCRKVRAIRVLPLAVARNLHFPRKMRRVAHKVQTIP
jgi:hypothetical protein